MNQLREIRKKKRTVALALLGVALAAAVALYLTRDCWLPPKTILVNGTEVVVNDKLKRNPYTEEDFAPGEKGRMQYLSGPYRTGVDVSTHQGEIDWKKVAADGIDFVMLRVGFRGFGNGTIMLDSRFEKNAKAAAENGLAVGAYFFSQAITPQEALEEADFVLKQMEGRTITMPIAYDWERIDPDMDPEGTARTVGVDSETLSECAVTFCQRIEEAGYQAMVYCNNDTGYFNYDIAQLQDYPIWFASFDTGYPYYYYQVNLWQYTDSGTVDGIEGPADLNLLPLETDPMDGTSGTGGASESASLTGRTSDSGATSEEGSPAQGSAQGEKQRKKEG